MTAPLRRIGVQKVTNKVGVNPTTY